MSCRHSQKQWEKKQYKSGSCSNKVGKGNTKKKKNSVKHTQKKQTEIQIQKEIKRNSMKKMKNSNYRIKNVRTKKKNDSELNKKE